jgi:hypothetical protein
MAIREHKHGGDSIMRRPEGPESKTGLVLAKFKSGASKETIEEIAREQELEIVKIVSRPSV